MRNLALVLPLLFSSPAWSKQNWTSSIQQTPLLELYSSESCSSCPPADQYFSTLQKNPGLWKEFVPVVFHVDYWNHLNWKDEYSSARMTARQRAVTQNWAPPQVYTPGVAFNGKAWNEWRSGASPKLSKLPQRGVLKLSQPKEDFTLEFAPSAVPAQGLTGNLVIMAMNLSTKVTSGENSGQTLLHDFLVIDWRSFPLTLKDKTWAATVPSGPSLADLQKKYPRASFKIAAWVEDFRSREVQQAVGGDL